MSERMTMEMEAAQYLDFPRSSSNWVLVDFSAPPHAETTAAMVLHHGTWSECDGFASQLPKIAADGALIEEFLSIMPAPVWNIMCRL